MNNDSYLNNSRTLTWLRVLYCRIQAMGDQVFKKNEKKRYFGFCTVCGHYARFSFHTIITKDSQVAQSCQWDDYFIDYINKTNTFYCNHCFSSFRVRCAAEALLPFIGKRTCSSIGEYVKQYTKSYNRTLILETVSKAGVFSCFYNVPGLIKSEYFDNIPRGDSINGVRSEDLQDLTFPNNYFDVLCVLDVFEHIADPWKAFAEISRVLKRGGVAVITVPLDIRKKTKTLARMDGNQIIYLQKPSYHLDGLRPEGVLVFTEFGGDLYTLLRSKGYHFDTKSYTIHNAIEHVLIFQKI
jgi:SAM-dependent methyltransferase